ncbi:glycoside hydrolase family 27 protein [Coraliomargarita sp. W4R72]
MDDTDILISEVAAVYSLPGHDGLNGIKPYVLTPEPLPEPVYNGATLLAVRPLAPILFRLPVSGIRPLQFSVDNLPDGVILDPSTGILTGELALLGSYPLVFHAENQAGRTTFNLELIVGEDIALTPPMGWNSWNAWGEHINEGRVRAAANAFVELGLADFGWSYINIDDGWQGERDEDGALQPDAIKFPDMQTLCDDVHGLGLKIGIYSAPWVKTFAGYTGGSKGEGIGLLRDEARGWFVGAQHFEREDAAQWARWGIDYLKYDWNPMDLASGRRMAKALRECGRDIIYNVTNSIHKEPPEKWAEISQCFYLWRTVSEDANTGSLLAADIQDDWEMVSNIGFNMNKWRSLVSPGHWNDPDMLVVGAVGWGKPHPSHLTPNEQYTHISLWCLLAAPLLLGCDFIQTRDAFTLGLLKNREVISVNQDRLGDMGLCLETDNSQGIEVVKKEMHDGSVAVGLFNRNEVPQVASLQLSDIDRSGIHRVRDLWRQQDIATIDSTFRAEVPAHGVILIQLRSSHTV